MPPLTPGAHCLGIGCDHAGPAEADAAARPPRPGRRTPARRAGRHDDRRAARRALLWDATRVR